MTVTKIAEPSRLHYYYQEHVFGNEAEAYERILKGYLDMTEEISLEDLQLLDNRLQSIHEMVLRDHPELFWTNGGYSYTMAGEGVKSLLPMFTMNPSQRAECQLQLDQALPVYTQVLRGRMKDYEAALKIYERMINMLDYDSLELDNQTRSRQRGNYDKSKPDHLRSVYGALVQKKAVCVGYAKGFQYILQSLGIECLSVTGPCKGDGSHQWNIIKLNGQYYHIDVTWGDGSNTDSNKNRDGISYDYFCLTEKDIKKTRTLDPILQVPTCIATKCNYFYFNHLYVSRYDADKVASIIRTHLSRKKGRKIQIRFAAPSMVKRAEKDFITDGGIFRLMDEAGVRYKVIWHQMNTDICVLRIWVDGWK